MEGTDPARIAGPVFTRVLAAILGLMFLSFVAWIALGALISDPTQTQTTAIEGASHVCTACLGTVLGLLGGKLS